ncbi:hypothetical protein RHMOL_Rhmol13G0146900 [Rhododendron molle]|uniref:Uncharacterized protein n=1 Tax=Rhododendron molle TaxID=49168 RepID=A0ACC0L7U0_RHOML|nr:hypothetical protein RHMOL_Rhmol13G0146900 [Rhododendron molle]
MWRPSNGCGGRRIDLAVVGIDLSGRFLGNSLLGWGNDIKAVRSMLRPIDGFSWATVFLSERLYGSGLGPLSGSKFLPKVLRFSRS